MISRGDAILPMLFLLKTSGLDKSLSGSGEYNFSSLKIWYGFVRVHVINPQARILFPIEDYLSLYFLLYISRNTIDLKQPSRNYVYSISGW